MELVYTATTIEEAKEVKSQLECVGVPATITGKNFTNLRVPFMPNNLGVFIYIKEQYLDAMKVIDDPAYVPEMSVDIEEFYKMWETDEFKRSMYSEINKIIGWLFVIILLGVMLMVILSPK